MKEDFLRATHPNIAVMQRRLRKLCFFLAMAAGGTTLGSCGVPNITDAAVERPNLILIIGDGMDDQQITIARNYLAGSRGQLLLDTLPYRGMVQVQAVKEDNPAEPNYVADSASTATAMASGIVTSRRRIGTTAQSDEDVVTFMEMAQAAGLRTGLVSTASVTDATPASFVAHISQRYCHGPENMIKRDERLPSSSTNCSADYRANGGGGSIAEQIAASGLDIVLGGGMRYFDDFVEGSDTTTVIDEAGSRGFITITHRQDLKELNESGRVLGLFSPGTMPVRYRAAEDGVADFLTRVDGKVQWPEAFSCELNPAYESVPTLREMTDVALDRLGNDNGFALMIESASIDKQAHDRKPCGHIGEVEQLLEVVQAALDFQKEHANTLILITADHGHSAQLIPDISGLAELEFASPGRFARVRTPEGGTMGINYASNDSPLWDEHSGVQVPLYAIGPGIEELPQFIRQSEIFNIALRHLELSDGQ